MALDIGETPNELDNARRAIAYPVRKPGCQGPNHTTHRDESAAAALPEGAHSRGTERGDPATDRHTSDGVIITIEPSGKCFDHGGEVWPLPAGARLAGFGHPPPRFPRDQGAGSSQVWQTS